MCSVLSLWNAQHKMKLRALNWPGNVDQIIACTWQLPHTSYSKSLGQRHCGDLRGGVVSQETYEKHMIAFNMRASLFTESTASSCVHRTPTKKKKKKTLPSSAVFTHLSKLLQDDCTKFSLNLVPEISGLRRSLMSSENGKSWKSMQKSSLGNLKLTTPPKVKMAPNNLPLRQGESSSRPSLLGSILGLGSVLVNMMFDSSLLYHTGHINANLYYFTNLSYRFWRASFPQPPNI